MKAPVELHRRRVKRNGCACPPHPLQAFTYFVLANQAVVSALIMGPLYPQLLAVPLNQVLFAVISVPLQLTTIVLGLLTTYSDPTDPVVYAHRKALQTQYPPPRIPFETAHYPSICTICNTSVQGSSKHCGFCNRCVSEFDHHCKWMNNCIGGENYRMFVGLIGTLAVSQGVFCAFAGVFLREAAREEFQQKCRDYSGWDSMVVVEVMVAFALLMAALTAFGVSNLIALHIWLRKIKHMTTYDYIISQRKSAKYKENVFPTQHNNDSDRLDNSEHSYQIPLVSKAAARHTNRIVPEIGVGVVEVLEQSGEPEGENCAHIGVVSPITDLSREGRKEDPGDAEPI